MATRNVASWVHDLKYTQLPPDVVRAAVQSFYNWAGCAIGGSDHEAVKIAHNALKPFFGRPSATLLGREGDNRTDPQHAALLNGIASHVHDYDDTHLDTIIHPTGPVASALLAAAEWRSREGTETISGKNFLLALVAGIEVECKLGLAVWPQHYDVGWHITSTTGSVGAAVAVAKLLGLSRDKIAHAVGVAATQVVGLREMFGSHTKSFHPGRAAQAGLMAALLAKEGYTSSDTSLEAKRGWANVIHEDMQKEGLKPEDIESVHAKVHYLVLELTGKKEPKDGLQGKFSVYHGGACGLLFGKATPSQYEDSVVRNAEVIGVRDRIHAEIDDSLGADETKVVVTMNGGRTLEKHVVHAVGSMEVPLDEKRLQEKFMDQCQRVLGEAQAGVASKTLWAVENAESIASITSYLAPRERQ
ncbi:2-methylcitrate dehydratase PrpD [Cryphonectria parasitica EP155]|uniref:2-methylcitrate dehydratase PrpD n=1 Tax=Cryphonectria parasitica (strain ATCC 38755 / EP155) TaxID=660469 RepID=A0A9P4XXU2_CRYP1|nr:2-methylcitrate dehydratase PrpD [Cryphonectria parasitica EP155]KAF3763327.1 2-methylcitrate dehydratase PrpD [Cryphonectria parasitica EP155]